MNWSVSRVSFLYSEVHPEHPLRGTIKEKEPHQSQENGFPARSQVDDSGPIAQQKLRGRTIAQGRFDQP